MWGKHYASAYKGSMVGSGPKVYAVWGYVIAHTVEAQVTLHPSLIKEAIGGMTVEEVEEVIAFLCAPDPKSNNKDEDGRRLLQIGAYLYHVVSYDIYHNIKSSEEQRKYNREAQAKCREKKAAAVQAEPVTKKRKSNPMKRSTGSFAPLVGEVACVRAEQDGRPQEEIDRMAEEFLKNQKDSNGAVIDNQ